MHENLHNSENSRTFAPAKQEAPLPRSIFKVHRGVEQLVARQAHNLEVARSNPASATQQEAQEKSWASSVWPFYNRASAPLHHE